MYLNVQKAHFNKCLIIPQAFYLCIGRFYINLFKRKYLKGNTVLLSLMSVSIHYVRLSKKIDIHYILKHSYEIKKYNRTNLLKIPLI